MSLPLYPKPLKYWGNSNLRLVVPCSYTLGWAYLNFNYGRLIILEGWVHQSSGLWEEQTNPNSLPGLWKHQSTQLQSMRNIKWWNIRKQIGRSIQIYSIQWKRKCISNIQSNEQWYKRMKILTLLGGTAKLLLWYLDQHPSLKNN